MNLNFYPLPSLVAAMVLGLAGPARGEVTEAMRKAVDRVIEEKAEAHLVPGIAVVVMEGEKVAYSFCRGPAGSGKITPETPFIVGSISKLFTATAVMQLVDRGKIELDVPVQRYLPEFRVADADALAGSPCVSCLIRTAACRQTPRAPPERIEPCRTTSKRFPGPAWPDRSAAATRIPVQITRCWARSLRK